MIDESPDGEGGYPAPPPIPKSSAYILGADSARQVDVTGRHCGHADCAATVARLAQSCGAWSGAPVFEGTVRVLPRRGDTCLVGADPDVCGEAEARAWLGRRVEACSAAATAFTLTLRGERLDLDLHESTDPRVEPMFEPATYIDELDTALRCVADAAVAVNTFGDPADRDGDGEPDRCDVCPRIRDDQSDGDRDGVGDACDVCPSVADDQRDADRDGVGDACDCVLPETRDARRCWDEETKPELGGSPGLLECPDGAEEPVCRSAWPDYATWMDEEIFGPDWLDYPELEQDLAATMIDYVHDDGRGNCPPGARCDANRAQQRGRDYEDWLCVREKRKDPATQCRLPGGGPANLRYRTEALRWSLPRGLQHQMQQVIALPEGRVRLADYRRRRQQSTHQRVILGEAKCYNPFIEWNVNSAWAWMRAVGFGTQLWDYVNKVIASRRTDEPYSVVYHFCDFIPRHVAYETTAALAATAAHGFTLRARDSPLDAIWLKTPGCYVDMADMLMTAAPELFSCFVPGQLAADGIDPVESCTGLFYDLCSGSE